MGYVQEGGQTVTTTIKTVASTVMDVTTTVVGTTTDIVVKYTPGLKGVVLPHVHTGFWEAYSVVREFVHRTLRRELLQAPAHVCFTGHSLGGALASIAAIDFKIHSAPRIDAYLRFQNLA
jgi:predicted lipase